MATTRTIGPLHFEDLDPKRFEDLVRQLAYEFKPWRRLEATGRSGSDDGFDARGYEIVVRDAQPSDSAEEGETARMGNREQREEIGRAQRFLREWYGVQYQPQLTPEGRRMIAMLEATPAGAQFNRVFLRSFSNHHLSALAPSLHCIVKSDLNHDGLQRYCENIVVVQKNGINDMREMLCKQYSDCGFIPLTGDKRKDNEF